MDTKCEDVVRTRSVPSHDHTKTKVIVSSGTSSSGPKGALKQPKNLRGQAAQVIEATIGDGI